MVVIRTSKKARKSSTLKNFIKLAEESLAGSLLLVNRLRFPDPAAIVMAGTGR
jgi:hypothetical protein